MRFRVTLLLSLFCVLWQSLPGSASALSLATPEQLGVATVLGRSYDPEPSLSFAQLSLMALYDYEQIMSHPAPEPLRFKLEVNLGFADAPARRMLASANFFALYYLRALEFSHFRPYVEAGAGIVYGDFQVSGQGLRMNFNPQAGIGAEWQKNEGRHWYGALRGYHISNGELHRDNRGINAVTLHVGVFF
jgi:hypothetical protein